MLEDQVAYLLQRYLGNYVRGLNKEALKISVWQGDVELKNMQLKPEALNALKLPVKVKAGFLGSVKIKVPWSRLGQDPVLVYLDRIFLLAEPETQVEGCSEDSVQETKRSRVRQMELKLVEKAQMFNTEVNKSWLGSLINTVIGNLKLSISNIHFRYEDVESNPGRPFAAGLTLEKLSAFTVDGEGKETFITGGSLDRIQKSIELDQLAFYLDSDISPWHVDKRWEDLLPPEWVQVFRYGTRDGKPADHLMDRHSYILQPVTGNAKYIKLRPKEADSANEPLQKAAVNLDDVTLCLTKEGYRNILKLVDNFAAFNLRLRYAHYRPLVSIKSDPGAWWKYAFKVASDQMKKATGKLSWDQVLRYTTLRKRYISLYASLLKSDPSRTVVDDDTEIESLDRGLDMDLIIQWRMLAHKLVDQSLESFRQQKEKKSWWSLGWGSQPDEDESKPYFSEKDLEQLNKMIGYKEGDGEQYMVINRKADAVQTFLDIHMTRNASKLIDESGKCLAELSCERLDCSVLLYPETKAFDMRLGSYRLSSPSGLLAESAASNNSLVGAFCYKPFDANVDWRMKAKASPCYMTYLKDSVDLIVKFFESNTAVSHTTASEAAAAVQMTIDGVRRSAQQQVNRALKDHARFLLDLDIAAPKITIPTEYQPNRSNATKLLLDLGHLVIRSQDDYDRASSGEQDMYWQFDLVLSDVSAFLIDGDYQWNKTTPDKVKGFAYPSNDGFLPVIDKCGVILTLQQIRLPNPSYPSTRLALRVPSLGFHFSPARYHRLLQVAKIFEGDDVEKSEKLCPWDQADFEGWLSLLNWKGVGNREAVWQRRYFCLVGPFLYVLEGPGSKSYKQYLSLRGKQLFQVPAKYVGNVENVLAVCSAGRLNSKVVEDVNALILRCDSDESTKTWRSRLQGAIYRASGSAPISGLSETSSESEDSETEFRGDQDVFDSPGVESVFIVGHLDELKICFACCRLKSESFTEVLLPEESQLFEFRAIGGQVELSIRENDMFIGMVLKSLEIEDLICRQKGSRPRYLARSLIRSIDESKLDENDASQSFDYNDSSQSEGEDKFYEAPENLVEPTSVLTPRNVSEQSSSHGSQYSDMLLLGPPSFSRIAGLLPGGNLQPQSEVTEPSGALDSFVKAQIVMYDQNSVLYRNIDKQVRVSLATLSFFCRRPMILAIIDFVTAINIEDESCESSSDNSPIHVPGDTTPTNSTYNDGHSMAADESVVKGLLGKGKSRIVFQLTINMARAQILLINEDESKLATLSQDNLLTDIKMFPSSFSIKASLGNLKISDDSLRSGHMYFWICDMRNPGGSSFVELLFTSFNIDDEDYEGYEYSLFGQLSEVRIVYLNRFVQEVISYFMGLVPNTSKGIVKLKNQVTDSEKWFTTNEIEGSPAVKLDLSLMKPIILMPRMTNSPEYLKLDVVHITIRNTFQWLNGSKSDINAIRLEILTIEVKDINLKVGVEAELGESIIQDVKGVSVIIRRSLRDLFHKIPNTHVSVKINELQAALSNKEYRIITECALSNISETPHAIPELFHDRVMSSVDMAEPVSENIVEVEPEMLTVGNWIVTEVSVVINLVELRLHMGATRDTSLATLQVGGAWLLYKSTKHGEGFLSSTLKKFTVIDDREGTAQEFKLAVGIPQNFSDSSFMYCSGEAYQERVGEYIEKESNCNPVPAMLILDARFSPSSTSVSLSIQRPKLLVALDFLLEVVEFFVPAVGNVLSNEDNKDSLEVDAILLDQSIYWQPSDEISLSPQTPLIADDEKFNHFVYDGKGGVLYLKDRQGSILSAPSSEGIIYVGTGKRLQFKNVAIKNGQYLDSCIVLGANSSYSASMDDQVYLDKLNEGLPPSSSKKTAHRLPSQAIAVERTAEFIIELQAIGPELTFYNTAKDVGESSVLSNKLLHAQLDAFCRLVQKGDTTEMSANVLGLTMESNGIRIIEPFDISVKYSNAAQRTNMHLTVSDIFMNFSFSILRLFLAVEDDILTFLRMTSKQITVKCTEFDKVGTLKNPKNDQIYAFWRPRAPAGFAVLGDYVTPLDKPPTKGILAVNINFTRVKKPLSFKLVWPPMNSSDIASPDIIGSNSLASSIYDEGGSSCSVWFPEAPAGYVAMGCVVSQGRAQPPLSSVYCIMSSLVSPGFLRDCIAISSTQVCAMPLALWRVDNSFGTFLPADPSTYNVVGRAYELRHMLFVSKEVTSDVLKNSDSCTSDDAHCMQSERSSMVNSGRRFEAIASFQLLWWNQGSSSRKQISIWRPVVPQGMVYFGDIVVKGFEPPSSCIVLNDTIDDDILKCPSEFQHVGQIRKQRGIDSISFWLPQAPPGFVSLGCIACKGTPKSDDFSALRCIRSDMVTGDHFSEESIWDTFDARIKSEPFSIWAVENELGNFIVRSGLKKPPKRFAFKLADPDAPSCSDDTVIDAEIRTFSAALFDDYGGLMVPLFNVSLSGIGFSLHGRPDHMNSTVSFSLAMRSYNDKYELWEPLIEPVDGVVRYQYDLNAPGATSQLRVTSTKDLNLNISVSNCNMIIQAYASWNNLGHVPEYNREREPLSPTYNVVSTTGIHHKKNYYIIPQNKLGQDIFIRATEVRGLQNVTKMPSGDMKPIKVPVSKDMLDSHLKGSLYKSPRAMVMIIIADAQLTRVEEYSCHQYTLAIRLMAGQGISDELLPHQQSARTSGSISNRLASELETVNWNEIFFFKVDSPDYYTLEIMVTEVGKGNPVGFFSAPLTQIGGDLDELSNPIDFLRNMTWIDLQVPEPLKVRQGGEHNLSPGRVRCAVLLSTPPEASDSKHFLIDGRKSGFIQISPSREGPWTTVRLNYAAPAACWRLGNDVVAAEVNVKDGNRYVNIRSLVSVHNNTDLILDLCLMSKTSSDNSGALIEAGNGEHLQSDSDLVETEELFETELYNPTTGWVSCSGQLEQDQIEFKGPNQETCSVDIPSGWEWIDDWHLDTTSISTSDGWVYAPNTESLKWPETFDSLRYGNYARQRRWVRHKRKISGNIMPEIHLGPLKPGDIMTLPLSALTQSREYVLQLRPSNMNKCGQYTWSSVVDRSSQPDCLNKLKAPFEIFVSDLMESHKLLYCNQTGATSSNSSSKLWFCVNIQATEIAKDIRSDPIQDWRIEVKAPLSIANFLPLAAEYSVLEMQASGHFVTCSRGVLVTGETEKLYSADIQNPLFLSLIPQRGWLPKHEVVLISHPHGLPSKTFSLRSSISGRDVQVVLEQNSVHEQELVEKIIRVYASYWFSVARCPPLTCRIVDMKGKNLAKVRLPFRSRKKNELTYEEITEEEIYEGHTIASALNCNTMGLTVAISHSNEEQFGPVKDLSSLGDMDGSLDLYAYNADKNCARLFVSTKPCPYQSVPTKVISIRPFMTFTNRLGQDMFIKLSSEDDPKVLYATDTRISFVYRETGGTEKLQVRLADTEWSFPVKIVKEDTISLVVRTTNGSRRFIKTEIRGYEEGSRFVVVFRLGSTTGPIRFENRTTSRIISIRQSGFGDDAWIQLEPLATTNFCWEDPYGQKYVDAKVDGVSTAIIWKLNFEESGFCSSEELGMQFQLLDDADVKVAKFIESRMLGPSTTGATNSQTLAGNSRGAQLQSKTQKSSPIELVVELGVVGISVIDHRPKELSYFYLERVLISYSTGYDNGATSRFKLIVGHLQLDNQLPLTLMPILMAPEQATDITHPVFKMTITIRNEDIDGIQVYPYVYVRVTDKCWRLNIHEPIIWALVDFYNSLRINQIPSSSSVTQVDPEIRFDLIDVSEVRLKLSLETAPAQRPRGVLGVWSPILSAVGNAFKIQVHLRRVMHRDRFMRKSSILPAIGNRIWRDLIHNPLHLIFSVDVLGMTRSTLASLSKGFAELSTDGQFLQLRAKQIWSRRITGVGDGFIQGTEALAQGFAFGVTGVVTKPMESARQNGLLGLAQGLGRAFVGFIAQPVSGALDFFSLTVGGIGASCSKCLDVFSDRTSIQRIRIPRAIRADGILREYCEREALGQMILYLAESSRHFGCTEIFKEPSKFAWTDAYEEHFIVPHQRIVLVTNRRVLLVQCVAPDKMDKKPCKITWDVPWEELMAVELAKAGCPQPSHIILHLKSFKRSETFVRVIKCNVDMEINVREPQASRICSVVRKMWKTYQLESKSIMLKVPSSQRNVYFAWSETDDREPSGPKRTIFKSRDLSSISSASDENRFVKHSINFSKIWSSEQESKSRCALCKKQESSEVSVCSIWRPKCPDGYTFIGDIAHAGSHPPNVSAMYRLIGGLFARPLGYDLVWRNCEDEYISPVSIWHPRAPDGFVSPGCVAVAGFKEPEPDVVHCIAESLTEETEFENQRVWSAPESYPWACHIYQVQSDALHFVALRQTKEESDWKPMRVHDLPQQVMQSPP